MSLGFDIDQKIEMVNQIKKAVLKSGEKETVYISFDEYSGAITLRSISTGTAPEFFIRHADIVKIANITMLSSFGRQLAGW
jgi:hypothetical protein